MYVLGQNSSYLSLYFADTERFRPWPYGQSSDTESIYLVNVAVPGILLNADWPHDSLALALVISSFYLIDLGSNNLHWYDNGRGRIGRVP